MQSQVYTQDDLKQILQKVISQRPISVQISPLIQSQEHPQKQTQEQPAETIHTQRPEQIQIQAHVQEALFINEPLLPIDQIEQNLATFEQKAAPKLEPLELEPPAFGLIEKKISTPTDPHSLPIPTVHTTFAQQENTLEERPEALPETGKKGTPFVTKKKNTSSNQEIEKYKEAVRTLTLALQEEQNKKNSEVEQAKNAIRELTKALQETKQRLAKAENEATLALHASQTEQETKQRLLRLIADKKELEDTITSLSCEKATLAARLQSLKQKSSVDEETHSQLTNKLVDLTTTLENTTLELASAQNELQEKQALLSSQEERLETIALQLQTLKESHDSFKSLATDSVLKIENLQLVLESKETQYNQELSVCQACILERSQALEEEQKNHRLLREEHLFVKKRLEEQENHLKLLEQHLGRRVKECALLSKQLEEQMDRVSNLQTTNALSEQKIVALEESLQEVQKTENSLRSELTAKSEQFLKERQDLFAELDARESFIAELNHVKAQFQEIEPLIKQCMKIVSTKPPEAPIEHRAPKAHKDFFQQATFQKPPKNSFFD